MSEDTEIEVPVLEMGFDKFLEMIKKVNLIDCVTYFSMPDHLKKYADNEKLPVGDLILELLEYHKEENEWRLTKNPVVEAVSDETSIKFLDKTILDASRVIIVSKMNSVFIIPGEKSISEGNCLPNQIIKFSNLISSQLFLLKFSDIKDETQDGKYDLKAEYCLIDKASIKNHED